MHIPNWNDDLTLAVQRRCAELSAETTRPIWWEAAQAAKGLPVYCDLGACLVIQQTGRVMTFDLDSRSVRELDDESWLLVARAAAAERHPEFQAIKPLRPNAAIDCNACVGTGKDPQFGLRCGVCMGMGWVKVAAT
jgi:hypothetical protein